MKIDVGKLVGQAVGNAVEQALTKEAAKPSNSLEQSDVKRVSPSVESAVKGAVSKEIQSVVDNATNSEAHWWQKRSRWAMIVSAGGVVLLPIAARYGLDGYLTPENLETVVDTMMKASGALTAYLAYRAGTAAKPLGE